MKEKTPDPHALRVESFCRQGEQLSGSWPLAEMPRLKQAFAAPSDGNLSWSAQGRAGAGPAAGPQLWLRLQAQAVAPLQCQRCLGFLAVPLTVDRLIGFVESEDEAARLDEQLDDDVLSLPARLDLHALLEDELILSLPIVPRHDGVCPEALPLDLGGTSGDNAGPADGAADAEQQPHPFAALAALKGRTGP